MSNVEANVNSEDPIELGSSVAYAGGREHNLIVLMSKQCVTIQYQHRYAVSGVGWYFLPFSVCKKSCCKKLCRWTMKQTNKDYNGRNHGSNLLKVTLTCF